MFGTLNHATTFGCIKAISEIFKRDKVETVLDMGCGTGILGVFALKLGALKVFAFDINHLATVTALKNFLINRMKGFLVFQAKVEDYFFLPADLALANLPFAVLKRIWCNEEFWNTKKWVVVSGVFPSQREHLLDLLYLEPFLRETVSHTMTIGDKWPTLIFKVDKR